MLSTVLLCTGGLPSSMGQLVLAAGILAGILAVYAAGGLVLCVLLFRVVSDLLLRMRDVVQSPLDPSDADRDARCTNCGQPLGSAVTNCGQCGALRPAIGWHRS